jgi:hypothetical protein
MIWNEHTSDLTGLYKIFIVESEKILFITKEKFVNSIDYSNYTNTFIYL